nr:MAG TPA: hypothetical protein [Caudoviricetes sp.]
MEEMEKTTPEIKPKKKKPMVTAIILIVIVIAIIGALAGGEKDKDKQDNQQNQQQQQEDQNGDVDMSVIAASLKAILDKNSDGTSVEYDVDYDDDSITIYVKSDGAAAEIAQAKASGYDDTYEPWVKMRDSMVTLCNSAVDAVEAFGVTGKYVTVTVVNDANEDNTLLTIMNGVVVYDVMAEK